MDQNQDQAPRIAQLEADNARHKAAMQLHAGDVASLTGDLGRALDDKQELEAENARLREQFAKGEAPDPEPQDQRAQEAHAQNPTEIRDLLENGRIVSFEMAGDRRTCTLTEECDRHYEVPLTKSQMRQFAREIGALADGMEE